MTDNSESPFGSNGSANGTSQRGADNLLVASGDLDPRKSHTELRFADGQSLRVPTSLFLRDTPAPNPAPEAATSDAPLVIPVIEEQLRVGKRVVPTSRVVLEKQVQEYEQTLDVPLAVRTCDIERVTLNRPVEAPPPVRQEGDTTIYSLVEEQLVLSTQLVLTEEVRVTWRNAERRDNRTVTLKRENLTVTRTPLTDRS